jgi:hypothetical protein
LVALAEGLSGRRQLLDDGDDKDDEPLDELERWRKQREAKYISLRARTCRRDVLRSSGRLVRDYVSESLASSSSARATRSNGVGRVANKLRAGLPVTVQAVELPARFDGLPAPASHAGALCSDDYWRRQNEALMVHLDNRVTPAAGDSDIHANYRAPLWPAVVVAGAPSRTG